MAQREWPARRWWLPPLFFFVSLSLLTYPGVLAGRVVLPVDWLYEAFYPWKALQPSVRSANPRQNDAIVQLYPLDLYTRERLLRLEAPLWNPYLGGGIPHLATGFTRALYPPAWPGLLLSPKGARNFELLFHLTLAGFFQLLFLRRLGCGPLGGLVGGMAFGWSGALSLRTPLGYVLDTLTWVPLLLYGVEGVVRRLRGSALVLALATALQILAGSLPDVAASWLLVSVYFVVRLISQSAGRMRAALTVAAALLLGAGLAAVQLVPQLELIQESHRGARSYHDLKATGTSPLGLLTLLSPRLFGSNTDRNYWLDTPAPGAQMYIGMVPFLLALGSLRGRSQAPRGALLAAGSGTYLVAAGSPALYPLLLLVPALSGLRYVHTFSNVCAVALSALAGLGAERLLAPSAEARPGRSGRAALAFGVLAAALGAGALGCGVTSRPGYVLVELALAAGVAATYFGVLALWAKERARRLGAAVLLLSAVDLVRFPAQQNPAVSTERFPIYPPTPGLDLVARDTGLYRALSVVPGGSDDYGPWVAGPNSLLAYRIPDAGAYHSFLPNRVVRYYTVMEHLAEGIPPDQVLASGRSFFNLLESYDFEPNALARLMNIRYVLYSPSDTPRNRRALRRLHRGELQVFQYVEQLPRAFLVEGFEVIEDPEKILLRLAAPDFDPQKTILLEKQPHLLPPRPAVEGETRVRVLSYRPERVEVEVEAPRDAFLVLCDTFFPGWQARVNGGEVELHRANYLFRAVVVPGGRSLVEFRYRPFSYRLGRGLSLASLVFWMALALGLGKRRQAQATTDR